MRSVQGAISVGSFLVAGHDDILDNSAVTHLHDAGIGGTITGTLPISNNHLGVGGLNGGGGSAYRTCGAGGHLVDTILLVVVARTCPLGRSRLSTSILCWSAILYRQCCEGAESSQCSAQSTRTRYVSDANPCSMKSHESNGDYIKYATAASTAAAVLLSPSTLTYKALD